MNALDKLTKQEQNISALVAQGWRTTKIAQELYISPRTVESHLNHIFDKLGISSKTEAIFYVWQTNSATSVNFDKSSD